MRILFCNYEYPPLGGGGGVINALLAEELATRHAVTVLTSRGLDLPIESREGGVRVVRVPVWARRSAAAASLVSMLCYVLRGAREGRRRCGPAFDIINTHFVLPSGPVGDALSRSFAIPNVLSVHGGDLYDPSKALSPHRHAPLRTWIRRLVRRADAVVGQSRNTLENLRTWYTPEVEGHRIPLGIRRPAPETADRDGRSATGFAADEVVLATVGRLVARKAIDQLIDMVARLGDPRVRLLVIGSGPLEESLRARARDRGVADRVRFTGRVDEAGKFRLLRGSDLFVSTSQHEGFGIVFLEAMACGLPVVCYDFGGQTDFLAEDRTGHLARLNDLPGFIDRCARLIANPAARLRIGNHNRAAVEEFFIDRCARRYETVFEAAIARRLRGPAAG